MPFDSTVMRAVVGELSEALTGGRISKIYQPEGDELSLLVYAGGRNHRLVLSANARFARLHLTHVEKKNPTAPPTFCMLMRKYVEGGRILAIAQDGRERICRIRVGVTDELGNPAEYLLLAEVMGKHSNVILIGPHGRIVDAIKRVTEEVNRYRELLPGLTYVPPPPVQKLDPSAVSAEQIAALEDGTAWQALLDAVDGLGPLLAKEAVVRAGGAPDAHLSDLEPDAVAEAVRSLASPDHWEPALLLDRQGRLRDFHVVRLHSWDGTAAGGYASANACADAFYGRKDEEDRFSALRGSLAKLVRDELARIHRKVSLQEASLLTAENAEEYRIRGELITANLWQITKGDPEAVVVNYYDPEGAEVRIKLDPALEPAANAQAYYRRYQRARSGRASIQEQLALSRSEQSYLEQVEISLQEAASLPDLEEIRRELQTEGYLREARDRRNRKPSGDKRGKATPGGRTAAREERGSPPLTVRSSDGLEIWVGRNNRQNDYLTLRLAAPHDLWFHTKEIPGSHVILRVPAGGAAVPERSVNEAAALAAWYSKGRESASVPVDYTLRKHVRKPTGARPGMVIYDHHKTLWVTPDPSLNPILQQHLEATADGTRTPGQQDQGTDSGDA